MKHKYIELCNFYKKEMVKCFKNNNISKEQCKIIFDLILLCISNSLIK